MLSKLEKHLGKLDYTKIEVLAGDIEPGLWDFTGFSMIHNPEGTFTNIKSHTHARIELDKRVRKINIRKTRQINQVDRALGVPVTTLAGMMLGVKLLGRFGAIAGMYVPNVLGITRTQVCVDCELTDGRKFLALLDKRVYDQLVAIAVHA